MHSGGRGAVLRLVEDTCIDMPFIRYSEEETYASHLALNVPNGSELTDADPITHVWSMTRSRALTIYTIC